MTARLSCYIVWLFLCDKLRSLGDKIVQTAYGVCFKKKRQPIKVGREEFH